ncbi:hypothetical protein EDS67_05870 [candidate division KSB1 bacterium]|nr:MAG: hypothetical protein EDS67_05870 [candidate division KSB1 bacterium]MBC6949644.1 hypothetical protein [candidate division KSB1 bacterium]
MFSAETCRGEMFMFCCRSFSRCDALRSSEKRVVAGAVTGDCHIDEVGQSSAVQQVEPTDLF